MRQFARRLQEALTLDSGTAPPPTQYGQPDDDGGDGWEPTPQQLRQLWQWVAEQPQPLVRAVLQQLDQLTPRIDPGAVRLLPQAGLGELLQGSVQLRASWVLTDADPAWPELVQQLRGVLLPSTLWRALGLSRDLAPTALQSRQLWSELLRALQFQLNQNHSAAFWLYERQPQAEQQARQLVLYYLQRSSQQPVRPDTLRLTPARPSNALQQYVPPVTQQGYGPGRLLVAAQLQLQFQVSTDLYSQHHQFGALPAELRYELVDGIQQLLSGVWPQLEQELELVRDQYGDVTVSPERLELPVSDYQQYFTLTLGELIRGLEALPPQLLRRIVEPVEFQDYTLELRPLRLGLHPDRLELAISVELE